MENAWSVLIPDPIPPISIIISDYCQDVHKVFVDEATDGSTDGSAYEFYGVDKNVGAAVIVRPDQCEYPLLLNSTWL